MSPGNLILKLRFSNLAVLKSLFHQAEKERFLARIEDATRR